jgi:succinoglycan biosynthesis protein ExoA
LASDTLVTIGLCVKNAEDTVGEAIGCVLQQDFPQQLVEILVVDGCSKDRTRQIIKEELSKTSIRHAMFSENQGLGVARQLVVNNSKSKYILWLDADMNLPRFYVRRQVEFMERNPKVAIATGNHTIKPGANLVEALEDAAYVAVDSKFRGIDNSRLPGTAGAIFRVASVREVGGFDPKIAGVGEDIELAYRLRAAGWSIYRATGAIFYENRKESWKGLWKHYVWYGKGAYRLFRKNRNVIKPYESTPISGFIAGSWYSILAYQETRDKRVLLLPLHYAFKRLAWWWGFVGTEPHVEACVS